MLRTATPSVLALILGLGVAPAQAGYFEFQVVNFTLSGGDPTYPIAGDVTFSDLKLTETFADKSTATLPLFDFNSTARTSLDTTQIELDSAPLIEVDPIHGRTDLRDADRDVLPLDEPGDRDELRRRAHHGGRAPDLLRHPDGFPTGRRRDDPGDGRERRGILRGGGLRGPADRRARAVVVRAAGGGRGRPRPDREAKAPPRLIEGGDKPQGVLASTIGAGLRHSIEKSFSRANRSISARVWGISTPEISR